MDNSFNEYWIYINRSIALVQQQHPSWSADKQVAQAEVDFNLASQRLWNSTIALCKTLRPKTIWGWYNFPGEANSSPSSPGKDDSMMWLYENVDALFPSIYLESANATTNRAVRSRAPTPPRRARPRCHSSTALGPSY